MTKSTYGLLVVVIPALGMNIRNFIKWSKEEKMKTSKLAVTKEMKLTDVQEELCMFFNDCFFQSDSNPIRMAKKLTKKFDVTTKKKRKK